MMIEGTKGEAKLIRQFGIIRDLGTLVVIAAITQAYTCVLIFQGIAGADIDDATNSVTPVECALRATQHLDRGDIAQIGIKR